MTTTGKIKELAFRYFNGEASKAEEQAIYDYLSADPKRLDLLKGWESEWLGEHKADRRSDAEWNRFLRTVRQAEGIRSKNRRRRAFILRSVSVAAILLVGLFSIAGIWTMSVQLLSDRHYVVDVPLGERGNVLLPDGTKVWLNAGSSLRYPERFNLFDRKVRLSGEGYFEVSRNRLKPFVVETGRFDVKVTGTRFNVSDYQSDNFSSVTLSEGKVEIRYGDNVFPMEPGEMMTYDKKDRRFIKKQIKDSESVHSWTQNRVIFDGISLSELITRLSRQYDRKIYLQSDAMAERKLRISLRNNETIEDVLKAMKDVIPIEYEIKDNGIYIREKEDR